MLEVPEVTDVDMAFPARALEWMPPMEEIPDQYKSDLSFEGRRSWGIAIAHRWFFHGLPSTVEFYPKDGVDPEKAVRAVAATLGSFAPQHEHKIAAVGYMLEDWFERVDIPEEAS